MNINVLSILLYTGCIQGLVLSVFFIKYSSLRGANLFGLLLILLSIHLVLVVNDSKDFFMRFPHLLHISWIISALYWPLVLMFVRRITRISVTFQWIELAYFAPFALILLYHSPFFLSSAEVKWAYIEDFDKSVIDDFGPISQLVSWFHVVFFTSAFFLYKNYQKRILNFMANEEARIIWLGQFLKISSIVVTVGLLVFYAKKFNVYPISLIYPYHFLGVIILIYWSAFKLIKQPEVFHSISEEEEFISQDKPQKPLEQNLKLAEQINHLMKEEKLYRTPGLTLHELANKAQSNKQYVSETINQVYSKNFYDYVNEYRLNEFTERLQNPKNSHLTLLALAYDAGFNSKATFNAVFKKHYGTTPSNYYRIQKSA